MPQLSREILADRLDAPIVTWEKTLQAKIMETTEITQGTPVIIVDAYGHEIRTRALSGIVDGGRFPVVWVERPLKSGGTDRAAWPAEAVRPA